MSSEDLKDTRSYISNMLRMLKNFNEGFRKFLETSNGGTTLQTGYGKEQDENITILNAEVLIMIIFDRFHDDNESSLVSPREIDYLVKNLQKAISKLTIFRRNGQ